MKKFVGLAFLGLLAFNSCDQGLSVSEKNVGNRTERFGTINTDYYNNLIVYNLDYVHKEFGNLVDITDWTRGTVKDDVIIIESYWRKDLAKHKKSLDALGLEIVEYRPTSKAGYAGRVKARLNKVYKVIARDLPLEDYKVLYDRGLE